MQAWEAPDVRRSDDFGRSYPWSPAAAMSLEHEGLAFNLLDTPGHQDFPQRHLPHPDRGRQPVMIQLNPVLLRTTNHL
jgi:hypothetical protein